MVWIPPTHGAHLDGPSGAPARHRSLRLLAHILLPVALLLPSSALAPSIDPRYSVNELQKWVQKTLIENEGRLIDQAGLRVDRQMG